MVRYRLLGYTDQFADGRVGFSGTGECWFLWMSALEGTSYANDGTGYVAGDFLNYCITE